MGNIIFTLRIYENPQIDNGISIDIENFDQKCKGMMIRNYKPNLMTIDKFTNRVIRSFSKELGISNSYNIIFYFLFQ